MTKGNYNTNKIPPQNLYASVIKFSKNYIK